MTGVLRLLKGEDREKYVSGFDGGFCRVLHSSSLRVRTQEATWMSAETSLTLNSEHALLQLLC